MLQVQYEVPVAHLENDMFLQENFLTIFFLRAGASTLFVLALVWGVLAPDLAIVLPVRPAITTLVFLLGLLLFAISWGIHWRSVAKNLEKKYKEKKRVIDFSH